MKGWILTTSRFLKEEPAIQFFAEKTGLKLVDATTIELVISNDCDNSIYISGEKVEIPSFIFLLTLDLDYTIITILHQLETLGTICINNSQSILTSSDKIYTSQILAAYGLPVAKTIYCKKDNINFDLIHQQLEYPVVVKVVDGTKGNGVYLANNRDEITSLNQTIEAPHFLIQEYISTSAGRDIRVVAFHGTVLSVLERNNSKNHDFRSNVALGGEVIPMDSNPRIDELAREVYNATKIDLCGIDLLFNGDDYVICELNSMPGGISNAKDPNASKILMQKIAKSIMENPTPRWKKAKLYKQALTEPLYKVIEREDAMTRTSIIKAIAEDAPKVQQLVLSSILKNAENSEYGKQYNFSTNSSIADFREDLPVTTWKDYATYSQLMTEGATDLLFDGAPDSFILSSGTTGESKYIPETLLGKDAKSFVSMTRMMLLNRAVPQVSMNSCIFPLVNINTTLVTTPCGIKCSYASGASIGGGLSSEKAKAIAFPPSILWVKDENALSYLTMRFTIEQENVNSVMGNNAQALISLITVADTHKDMIIADIRDGKVSYPMSEEDTATIASAIAELKPNPARASYLEEGITSGRPFNPSLWWNNLHLAAFWCSASVGISLSELLPQLPKGVKTFDVGYGASELKINLPLEIGKGDGLLSTTTAFYEFIPAGNENKTETLLAHELTIGNEYEIVVTTYSGLYRYQMNDIVKCTGYIGNTPRIEFICKGGDVSNIAGEKISGLYILDQARTVLESKNIKLIRLQAKADYQSKNYIIYIEADRIPDTSIDAEIDNLLQLNHIVYKTVIEKGMLYSVKVIWMKRGWQDELYRQKKAGREIGIGQIKLPIFIKEEPSQEWCNQ